MTSPISPNQHEHDYKLKYANRWRDIDRTEYTLNVYTCKCGAGYHEKIPVHGHNMVTNSSEPTQGHLEPSSSPISDILTILKLHRQNYTGFSSDYTYTDEAAEQAILNLIAEAIGPEPKGDHEIAEGVRQYRAEVLRKLGIGGNKG